MALALNLLSMMGLAGLGTAWAALSGIILGTIIAIYIYTAIALMTIAKKTDTAMAWLAWIPIANLYLITQIAEVPWWTILIMLLGFIPIAGILIILGLTAFWYWKISERRDKPGWLGILMIIPIANLVVIGILAWSD